MSEPEPIVFVVDDDLSVRRSTERLIRSIGLEIQTFTSAREFLKNPRPARPACLVLDVRMPGLSGMDLQRELTQSGIEELRQRYEQLTPREREVLPLVAAGLLNKQVAGKLTTTERTIKFHRAHIMKKACAESVTDLVRMVEKLGIERPLK